MFMMIRRLPCSTLFPYTTLFRSVGAVQHRDVGQGEPAVVLPVRPAAVERVERGAAEQPRSEEHTSELQSHVNLVCRLLLEKKKKNNNPSNKAIQTSR